MKRPLKHVYLETLLENKVFMYLILKKVLDHKRLYLKFKY